MLPIRRAARLRLLLGWALASPALAQVGGWQSSGPPLYQVNALATAPDLDATVYAGGSIYEVSQSAVFVSPDGGKSWRSLFQAPRGEFFTEIAVDPRHPERVFAGALGNDGTAKVSRSADGGTTWSLSQTVSPYCAPSFAFGAAPDTVLLSCGSKVFRSGDAGASWAELPTSFTEPMHLAAGSAGALFAYSATRIFRSVSDGDSWSHVADAPAGCAAILVFRADPIDSNAFFAGTGLLGTGGFQCGGVFKSLDSGGTWAPTTLLGVYVTDLVVDARHHASVYASAGYLGALLPNGGVYQSRDGGDSWTNLKLPALGALQLALSPSGRLLYAATSIGVFDRSSRKTRVVAPR